MAKAVISCVNLKGGVGKTALAVNLAAIAGKFHQLRTLLIDLDPQTNSTFWCLGADGWKEWAANNGTLANLFGLRSYTTAQNKKKDFSAVVRKSVFPSVDLLPSHLDLFTMDLDLAGQPARETILRRTIQPHIQQDYDLVVCDCPPNLTLPTQNAISISTHFVVPVSLDYLSSLGIQLLLTRIEELSAALETDDLKCAGIAISRVGRPALHRQMTQETLEDEFEELVLKRVIKERVAVDQAAQAKMPVHEFEPNGEAAADFRAVAQDVLKRAGVIP